MSRRSGHRAVSALTPDEFSTRLLEWFDVHGRKNLPWQLDPAPYRVWISEIMLQQTQVATVIPYYLRFMDRFPDVAALADAEPDEVLHYWSGLGYYARARNLHKAARVIRDRYDGEFPLDIKAVATLPGIGRSTAGAILALSAEQHHPILDGNVKRVLSRFHAVEGWSGTPAVARRLWELAEAHTPRTRVAAYTQAVMDLGATVCTRGRPACERCPVSTGCRARALEQVARFPTARPRRALPVRAVRMLMLCNARGEVLLERRPPAGIWGGLWSFPECGLEEDMRAWCRERLRLRVGDVHEWPRLRHTFSHFHMDITPAFIRVNDADSAIMEPGNAVWYNTSKPDRRGLAAPVRKLLNQLQRELEGEEHGTHGEMRKARKRSGGVGGSNLSR